MRKAARRSVGAKLQRLGRKSPPILLGSGATPCYTHTMTNTETDIHCTDCSATSATTFISVENELCNDCWLAWLESQRDAFDA